MRYEDAAGAVVGSLTGEINESNRKQKKKWYFRKETIYHKAVSLYLLQCVCVLMHGVLSAIKYRCYKQ